MDSPIVAIAVSAIVVSIAVGLVLALAVVRNKKKTAPVVRKDRNTVIKTANRQLAQNPKDHRALLALADLYFDERSWDKAVRMYRMLQDLCATNKNIEEWYVTLRFGLCAVQLRQFGEAYKALVIARSMKNDIFEINYNLGFLEFKRGNIERATQLLGESAEAKPEHIPTQRYLGRARFKQKRYKEALRTLLVVVDAEPDDRESLLYVAQSHFELGQGDQALAIFEHLRADPGFGPHASLYAGTIHAKKREYDKAIVDFEVGIRHEKIKPEVALELHYRLAGCYVEKQDLGKALQQFTAIRAIKPKYKDVADQIERLGELHSNRHLKTYMISSSSEFIALCRRIVVAFHENAGIKITDVAVAKKEYTDILADVTLPTAEDTVLFRFVRGTGTVGELMLRELNARIKEVRAGRGYCIAVGEYSEGARAFVEARLIDLLNKQDLLKVLDRVN